MTAAPETAIEIAAAVTAGRTTAVEMVARSLQRIAQADPAINAFTAVFSETALADAAALDASRAAGAAPGPLAGVPFAVKNLFDVAGITTLAGSIIDAENPPAARDATLVARLRAAGAILVGALNMDEYAYGFTTENSHYGATRNPHDLSLVSGGSSGGSAAAVAAGLVPLSLGSDTNGSIRVPAAFCGIYGLKPTFGGLSRHGVRPFVHSLDHAGPFTRTARDMALVHDVLQGHDPQDPASREGPTVPTLPLVDTPPQGVRAGRLGGWFETGADDQVLAAAARVAEALAATPTELPGARAARSAAFCITASEGGSLHLKNLRARPADFDPATRDRLIAGAVLPAHIVARAHRYRRRFLAEAMALFEAFDVLVAPATPFPAQPIGQATIRLNGAEVSVRANAGMYTQPISFIGLPVLTLPIVQPAAPPAGIQLIAAPGREALLIQVATQLERDGVIGSGPMLDLARFSA
jgi:AtzE family amidohydrolase